MLINRLALSCDRYRTQLCTSGDICHRKVLTLPLVSCYHANSLKVACPCRKMPQRFLRTMFVHLAGMVL